VQLKQLEDAIGQMFSDIDRGFKTVRFEFQDDAQFFVSHFLTHFDAIFTLNQDVLLERNYFSRAGAAVAGLKRWVGVQIPGMRRQQDGDGGVGGSVADAGIWVPSGGGIDWTREGSRTSSCMVPAIGGNQ
jgi:hypothetical protein